MATNLCASLSLIQKSKQQSEPTVPIFGGQGPYCPSRFQEVAPAIKAAAPTAASVGLETEEW